MRKLKFRVWNKTYKKMYFQDEIIIILDKDGVSTCFDIGSSFREYKETQEDLVYMQYTGIEDVGNKEIYEGDIVEVSNCMLENESDFIGFIEYNNGGFKINNRNRSRSIDDIMLSLKVIGNIYESKELL